MVKFKSKFISTLLAVCLFFGFCACGEESQPEDVIEKLETAFNTSNIDMMLECYEPSIQNMYKGLMEIGGQLMGDIDLQTIISGLGGFADVFGSELGMEMPKIDLVINEKEIIADDKVRMNITQYYDYNDMSVPENAPEELTSDMYLVRIDGQWYISAKVF